MTAPAPSDYGDVFTAKSNGPGLHCPHFKRSADTRPVAAPVDSTDVGQFHRLAPRDRWTTGLAWIT